MPELTSAQKQALDISHRRCCVTASAGTGKTFVLTQRYIAHLKAGAAAGEILCLTFTEKAAAEMREKIEREVKKTLDDADEKMAAGVPAELSDAEYGNLKAALKDIHRCTISTFHGFCSSVLKEFPIESQTPLGYAVMDELAEQEFVANTIEDTLEHPDTELWKDTVLLYSVFSANEVPKLIIRLLGKLNVCPEWFENLRTEEGREMIYRTWVKLCADKVLESAVSLREDPDVEVLMDDFAVNSEKYLPEAKDIRAAYDRLRQAETDEDMISAADELIAVEFSFKKYNSKISKDVRAQFNKSRTELMEFIPSYRFLKRGISDPHTQLMLSVMKALYEITAAVSGKVEAKKTSAGYLSFDDLINSAKELLKDEKICAVLAKRYKYVLVDEVQDNDTLLTDIINSLAGGDDSLFIVGDMKQSIYRFRGADPECVQNELFSTFPEDGWVTLDTNFRTVKPLIDAVNALFTCLYPEGNDEHIPYEPVKAHRCAYPETEGAAGTLTLLRCEGTADKEADLLARWIGKCVEDGNLLVEDGSGWHPAQYRDIAVLVRKKGDGGRVKKALEVLGIPCHDCSGDKMYTSVEIRDLLSVIRAAVCHEDDKALYAALKSPYFGITDAELAFAAYSTDRYPDNLWRRLNSFLSAGENLPNWVQKSSEDIAGFVPDCRAHLIQALSLLELFARTAVSDTLPHFIRLIYETTGIASVYAALPDGSDALGNLRQFLAAADRISAERGASVYEFLRIIDTCIEKKIDSDGPSDSGDVSEENRVQIMTYHVSKGLEFPVVALYRTGEKYNDMIKDLMTDEKYGAGHSALKYPGDEKSPFLFLQKLIVSKERPVSLREEKRLFYVGMTRARDHLVLTSKKDGSEESYMELFSKGRDNLEGMTKVLGDVDWTPDITSLQAVFDNDWCCVSSADEEERGVLLADISRELTETKEERTARYEEEKKRLQEAKRIQENILRGLCIHEIFEGKNPEETCRKYGCEEEQKKFEAALKYFRESDLLQNALEQIHELPLTTADGGYRRADLFVKYTNGTYAIFDYKSSASASVDALLREKYTAQLTEYSDILSAVYQTKEKIPAYLYYTGDRMFVRVV
ncbi:MAG TPA: UvrD-helicase domain-containing protein [Methanocorpusculum sp.]|nr:UvrD-helicase domain-containing protein [Methanocorpusculum sp.]